MLVAPAQALGHSHLSTMEAILDHSDLSFAVSFRMHSQRTCVAMCRYDSNNLVTETYDWRLATPLLEKRDRYFSRLRDRIRTLHSIHDHKVLPSCH